MSDGRNAAIEVSLDSLTEQVEILEHRLDSASGKDQVNQSEKTPTEHRPIGILIEQLPGDIENLTIRLKSLTATFDDTFLNADNGIKPDALYRADKQGNK